MPAATATNAAGVAAEEDPLTGLPNLRALESHLQSCPQQAICSLRIDNLDFLSRHYGLMMGWTVNGRLFGRCNRCWERRIKSSVPGSELILVLDGPEPSSRLNHMVAVLNHKSSAGTISRWIWSLARRGRDDGVRDFTRCWAS